MKISPAMSKQAGWDAKYISWPTLEEVKTARNFQLLMWYRFLPAAENDEQVEIINAIVQRIQS
jgi:hypothetical protein